MQPGDIPAEPRGRARKHRAAHRRRRFAFAAPVLALAALALSPTARVLAAAALAPPPAPLVLGLSALAALAAPDVSRREPARVAAGRADSCSGRPLSATDRSASVQLRARWVRADQESLRSDRASAWAAVPVTSIPLAPSEEDAPRGDRAPARAAIAEAGDMLFVRLEWTVLRPARSAVRAPHAACVMVPRAVGSLAPRPSIAMGERGEPVDLYSWHEQRGFMHLQADGPGAPSYTGQNFPGHARRTRRGWSVVFQLPVPPPRTPMAFAVWDGERGDRGRRKGISAWHEIWFD